MIVTKNGYIRKVEKIQHFKYITPCGDGIYNERTIYFETIEKHHLPIDAILSYDWFDNKGNKYTLMGNIALPSRVFYTI